jgi:hypothetical protein
MYFPKWQEVLTVEGGSSIAQTISSLSAQQVVKFKVPKRRGMRLERINIGLRSTAGVGAAHNRDGLAGLIQTVKLSVSDGASRNFCDAPAADLIALSKYFGLPADALTMQATPRVGALTASVEHRINVPLFVRHPDLNEPAGILTAIPCDLLADDPTLEIVVNPASSVFSAGAPTSAVLTAVAHYRDTADAKLEYIRSEITRSLWAPAGTGKQELELKGDGYPLSVLLTGYSSATYGNAVTSQELSAVDTRIQWTKGRIQGPQFLERENVVNWMARVAPSFLSATPPANNPYWPLGEIYTSFLTDPIALNPLGVNSMAPWRVGTVEDDKVRLVFESYANSSYAASVLQWMLNGKPADLALLNQVTV